MAFRASRRLCSDVTKDYYRILNVAQDVEKKELRKRKSWCNTSPLAPLDPTITTTMTITHHHHH